MGNNLGMVRNVNFEFTCLSDPPMTQWISFSSGWQGCSLEGPANPSSSDILKVDFLARSKLYFWNFAQEIVQKITPKITYYVLIMKQKTEKEIKIHKFLVWAENLKILRKDRKILRGRMTVRPWHLETLLLLYSDYPNLTLNQHETFLEKSMPTFWDPMIIFVFLLNFTRMLCQGKKNVCLRKGAL